MKQVLENKIENFGKYLNFDAKYFAKSGFWLNLNFLFSSIFSFILSIFLANILTKEVFGTYQFIISMAGFLTTLTLTGMNTVVAKDTAQGLEGTLQASIRPQITLNLISFFAAAVISVWYFIHGNSILGISFFIIATILPFSSAFNTYSSFLIGKKLFKNHFFSTFLFNVIYYGTMIFVLYYKPEITWLVFASYGSTAVGHFILYKVSLKKVKNKATKEDFKSRALHQSLSNILPSILLIFDNIVIYKLLGPAALAVYSLISIIPMKITGVLRNFITAAVPKISQYSREHVKQTIYKRIFLILSAGLLISLLYIIFAKPLFEIFFPEYVSYLSLTYLFTIPTTLSLGFSFITTSFILTQEKNNIYIYNTVYPIVSFIFIIIGAFYFGIIGIILARAIGYLSSGIIGIVLMKRN